MSDTGTSVPKSFIAGGFGGVCGIIVGQPLDTVKVRLQTQPHPKPGMKPLYSGMVDCAIKIFKYEGILGFFKGMSAPVTIVTPVLATTFLGFSIGKKLLQKSSEDELSLTQITMAGMFSGILRTPIVAPGERIKLLIQVQGKGMGFEVYKGPFQAAKALYKQGGYKNLNKGLVITFIRDVPAIGAYYYTYEVIRQTFKPGDGSKDFSPLQIILAGGTAGVVAWVVPLPADVIKSRLQTAPKTRYPNGSLSVGAELLKEGPTSLFKGFTPIAIRAFPVNATIFLGYEVTMKFMNWVAPDL